MCLTLHPFVSGRPGPSRALARLLDYAIDLGDVWIARADHIARWWLSATVACTVVKQLLVDGGQACLIAHERGLNDDRPSPA